MCDREQSKYGFGENPPYALYEAPDGKWGLIDGSGQKLQADFKRGNGNYFYCVPWEVVCFDTQEGFELQAWYDPDEVWFNFIFRDPKYPDEYGPLLWKGCKHTLQDIADKILAILPAENHWLLDCMFLAAKEDDIEDEEFDEAIRQMLSKYPVLKEPSKLNHLLYPIMSNQELEEEIKSIVWNAKVYLDYCIKYID